MQGSGAATFMAEFPKCHAPLQRVLLRDCLYPSLMPDLHRTVNTCSCMLPRRDPSAPEFGDKSRILRRLVSDFASLRLQTEPELPCPACSYEAGKGDAWVSLAETYYGSPVYGDDLAYANNSTSSSDPNGRTIILPCNASLAFCANRNVDSPACGPVQSLPTCTQKANGSVNGASSCQLAVPESPAPAAPPTGLAPAPAARPENSVSGGGDSES